jgi:hypothetical protein
MAAESIRLEVSQRANNSVLEVVYSLANAGERAIVTYDGAIGAGGGEYPNLTTECYVSVTGNVARILRSRPPAHPTIDTTRTLIPNAAEVKPGETRKVKFSLPLPLKERSEFSPEYAEAKYDRKRVSRLELRIGYFWRTPDTVLKPLQPPGVFQVVKGASLSEVQFVSATTHCDIEALIRTDPAFIRM